jgi:hypothetical protein
MEAFRITYFVLLQLLLGPVQKYNQTVADEKMS